MHRTNIYLEDAHVAELDRRAAASGLSRAAVLRQVLDEGLGLSDATRERALAAIEASFGALRDDDAVAVPGRSGSDGRAAHLASLAEAPAL